MTSNAPPAPSAPSFAQRVAKLEGALDGDPNTSLILSIGAVPYLLECIREQQAALESAKARLLILEGSTESAHYNHVCAVLAKWRVE